jgi:hypothetical protein
MRRRIRHAG